MSTYEKRIKTLMEYLKESDEKIHELQVAYEKEKNKSATIQKQINEYVYKIDMLNNNIDELEENLYNQQKQFDKEKTNSKILTNQVKDYILKIKLLNDKLDVNEENLYDIKLNHEELLKKYNEIQTINKDLQRNLKYKDDKEYENQLYILHLEKELVQLNNKVENIHKESESIEHTIEIEPKNTLSLFDEIELTKNKNTILGYKKLKKINKYIWIYRGLTFTSSVILIYCITELFFINNCV